MTSPDPAPVLGPHPDEPHGTGLNNRLNWLRAAVLGANDGIVSTAGIVIGAVGATSDRSSIVIAGVAGLAAGAARGARGGARRAGRHLRREGADRGPRPRGSQGTDRQGRAGRPRRG